MAIWKCLENRGSPRGLTQGKDKIKSVPQYKLKKKKTNNKTLSTILVEKEESYDSLDFHKHSSYKQIVIPALCKSTLSKVPDKQ